MDYVSVADTAQAWNIAERTVRYYCNQGRVPGAILTGKTWNIPKDAQKPERINKKIETLLHILKAEREARITGRLYHKVQIEFTYNSNRIEGSQLTHDQTRYIFETNTIDLANKAVKVNDIVETANHFRCVDMAIEQTNYVLSESFIKELHQTLKNGTTDSRKSWFAVGEYKRLPNEVGGKETTSPEEVSRAMKELLDSYNATKEKTLDEIIEFHVRFEQIHPFQDGNGRVGRLIMFKECLRNDIVPFIITDEMKMFYYRGLSEWDTEKGFLRDTCLTAQDTFKEYLNYFKIPY